MIRRVLHIGVILLVAMLGSSVATAQGWTEVGDAGDVISTAAQTTDCPGTLDYIDGSMIWDPSGDHADAYIITVTDAATFSASLDPGDGGNFTDDGGFEDDSRLYLLDASGTTMIMANDDKPSASLESYISDPSTFPGSLTNNPGSVVNGTQYIVVVTYYANDILDGGAVPLSSFSPFADLHGVDPGSTGVLASWENPGDFDLSWTYRIALTGAGCEVPVELTTFTVE